MAASAPAVMSISTSSPRTVLACSGPLYESPIWSEDTQRLFWVEQEGDNTGIHVLSPASGEHTFVPTPALTPAVILTEDPSILVVPLEQRIVEIDLSRNGEIRSVLATVPKDQGWKGDGTWRFNDSRAAPGGQIIAGRMPEEAWQDGEGGWVYQLAVGGGSAVPELSVLFGKGKFGLPNGMAWNLTKGTMYYNDTYKGKVFAIPCDDKGTPDTDAEWRTVLTLNPDEDGAPDGLAIDADGNLWVAQESGGKVGVYDADTGKRLHAIELPVRRPSAVAFGGPDLRQLYITTIAEEGEDASPDSGKLFVVDVHGAVGAAGAHKWLG